MLDFQLKELIMNIPWLVLIVFYNIVFFSVSFFFVCLLNQKFIIKNKYFFVIKKIIYCIIGIFFGFTSFLSNYIWTILSPQIKTDWFHNYYSLFIIFNTLVQLIIIFIYSSQISFFIMLFSSIGYSISIFMYTPIEINKVSILIIGYILYSIFLFLYRLFTPEKRKIFFVYYFLSLSLIFLSKFFLLENLNETVLIYFIFSILYVLVLFVVFFLALQIINIISDTNELQTSIYYDNFFIREWHARDAFENYVKLENINYGCIFLINFKNLEYVCRKESNNKIRYLKENIIQKFTDDLGDKALYLKGLNDEFYFFIKFKERPNMDVILKGNNLEKRSENDPLYMVDSILKKVPKKVINKEKHMNFNLNLHASIYGINSNSFDCLINDLSYINNEKNTYNKIIVFSPKQNFYNYEMYERNMLNNKINLDNIKINFYEKNNIINAKVYIYNNDFSDYYTIKKHDTLTYDNLITLSRYITLKIIKQYSIEDRKKRFLNLFYPIDFITSDYFDIESFISKIVKNNVDPKNINLNLFAINKKMINKKLFFIIKKKLDIIFNNVNSNYYI